jgi:hypothetical protein
VARDGDRPPRQPSAREPLRCEGGRPPGVERFDGQPYDRALVQRAARRGSRLGQAARLADAARDQLPARLAGVPAPRVAARVRRAPELPKPDEGPRPGRLFDRVRRHRRHGADMGRDRAPLPRASSLRGAADGSPDRPLGGRRARRGGGMGGDRGPERREARRGALGDRPQPPVARPGRARHRLRAAGGHVRGRRLAVPHRQVRPAPRGALRTSREARS